MSWILTPSSHGKHTLKSVFRALGAQYDGVRLELVTWNGQEKLIRLATFRACLVPYFVVHGNLQYFPVIFLFFQFGRHV